MPLSSGFVELDDDLDEKSSILIVDDLPEKLLVFETVLEDLGQNLVFVRSGNEALREVLKREFAVILLDVNMPDIDGFETASLIRKYKRSAHTPIIFITAYADEIQTTQGYSLGAVDYILSPVVPEVLRTKVKVFVDLHIMQRRVRRQADERVALAAAEAARRAAEENTRRSNFLSQASRVLSGSLDVVVGLNRLVELVVPVIGESAVVMLRADSSASGDWVRCVQGSLAGGESASISECRPEDLPWSLRDTFARVIDTRSSIAQGSTLTVPLLIGERALGALAVTGSGEPLDRPVLEDLASRAAIALENARLYRSLEAEIVERRQAQTKLQEANQRKDEFLAMLSHELRNPLAPIRNAIEVIRRIAAPEPRLKWATDVTDRQVNHLTRLVEELLDVARISQGKIVLQMEPIDLLSVIAQGVETVRPFIDARRHTLSIKVPDGPVWLRGDFARLSQVVANLLNNAAKYTEEGGRIQLSLVVQPGQAIITVRDNGMGIEPELLPNVFELFEQGKRSLDRSQGGLGVGLTLVQRLVQLHNGEVEVTSQGLGEGAEFRVLLPCLSEVRQPETASSGPLTAGPVEGCRVLVVDDNRDAAETVAMFLELAGHEVKSVNDGPQALTSAAVFAPEVVVLDIGLPGMDGYEVARRMRQLPETRASLLIALTGYGQKGDQAQARAAGFDHHLVKPADPSAVSDLIAQWRAAGRAAVPPGAARESISS